MADALTLLEYRPRNAYSRAAAAECGRLWARYDDEPSRYLADDYAKRALYCDREARRFQWVWWCSESAGVLLSGGELTLRAALVETFGVFGAVLGAVAAIGVAVYLLMLLGKAVL